MTPRKDKLNKEYLIKAFMRASVLFAGVDLQNKFFTENLRFVFEFSNSMARDLRATTPIRWVVHSIDKDVLADLEDNERIHDSIHIDYNNDAIDLKDGSTSRYRSLFEAEASEGADTVIVAGLYAAACVDSVIKLSARSKKMRTVVVINATNLDLYDRIVEERGYEQAVIYLKEQAEIQYGARIIPLTTHEIMECHREAQRRLASQNNTLS